MAKAKNGKKKTARSNAEGGRFLGRALVVIERVGNALPHPAILFGSLAVHIAQFVTNIFMTKPYVSAGILQIGLGGLARDLPGGTLPIWGVCSVVVAGCYWLAARQFDRMEIALPGTRTRE